MGENYCRDELFLKDEPASLVLSQGLINVDQLTQKEFNTLFARLGSVSYAVNTDMKEFKRKLNDPESEKPLILVYLHNKIFETLYKMMKPVFTTMKKYSIYTCAMMPRWLNNTWTSARPLTYSPRWSFLILLTARDNLSAT